jgi:hypothetical protein
MDELANARISDSTRTDPPIVHRGQDNAAILGKLADALARAAQAMPMHQMYIDANCGAS